MGLFKLRNKRQCDYERIKDIMAGNLTLRATIRIHKKDTILRPQYKANQDHNIKYLIIYENTYNGYTIHNHTYKCDINHISFLSLLYVCA